MPSENPVSRGRRRANPSSPAQSAPKTALPAEALENAVALLGVPPTLLKPSDVAEMLGVGARTLERWRMTGDGPEYLRLSRKTVRYTAEAVSRFASERARASTAVRT